MLQAGNLRLIYQSHLERTPAAIMLIQEDQQISYAQFEQLVQDTARWLGEQGVQPGDRIAVWLVNRVEWFAIFFALARLGAILVAVNTKYRSHELQYILSHSRANRLILQLNFKKIDFADVLSGVNAEALTHLNQVIMIDGDATTPATILGCPVTHFLPELHSIKAHSNFNFSPDTQAGDDHTDTDQPLIFFTTSGTTKGPKLVVHTQRTLSEHAGHTARAYAFNRPNQALLGALPLCGVYGMDSALGAIAAGMPIVLMDFFDVTAASTLIKKHLITHIFGSDEMLRRFAEVNSEAIPFPSLKLFGYAAFSARFVELAQTLIPRGFPMQGLYGSSEVHALFSLQDASLPLEERVLGGGAPAAGSLARVRARDPDHGKLCEPGVAGEIEIYSPTVFKGYYNNAEATAQAFTQDGYFKTGDLGYVRSDGSFVYLARIGDTMRLGGFLVDPTEIEHVLAEQPEIASAQVVALEINGQPKAVAFAIATNKDVLADTAAILKRVASKLAAFKVPAHLWFIGEFPSTASANGQKFQRVKLRELAAQKLGA